VAKLTSTATSTVIDVNPLSLQVFDSSDSSDLVPCTLAPTEDCA